MKTSTLEQLATDILGSAALAGAPANPALVRRVLDAFELGFSTGAVQLQTTSHTDGQRELCFRYVALGESHFPHRPTPAGIDPSCVDPWLIARAQGVLVEHGYPIERLLPALASRFPVGGWGVEAGAAWGIERLWAFLSASHPMARALRLSELPTSVASHRSYLARHALSHLSSLALDYRHQGVSLGFSPRPTALRAEQIASMIGELGFSVPERSVLDYNTSAVCVELTYGYDSPDVERLCFYVPVLEAGALPPIAYTALASMVERCPVATQRRRFIVGHTFARRGAYLRLGVDYRGNSLGCLAACAALPRAS